MRMPLHDRPTPARVCISPTRSNNAFQSQEANPLTTSFPLVSTMLLNNFRKILPLPRPPAPLPRQKDVTAPAREGAASANSSVALPILDLLPISPLAWAAASLEIEHLKSDIEDLNRILNSSGPQIKRIPIMDIMCRPPPKPQRSTEKIPCISKASNPHLDHLITDHAPSC